MLSISQVHREATRLDEVFGDVDAKFVTIDHSVVVLD